MKRTSAYLGALVLLAPVGSSGGQLYSVSPSDDLLRNVDPGTGLTTASVTMTVTGHAVDGSTALAAHPTTGELWAVMKLDESFGPRWLVTIDPGTGSGTIVGFLGDRFAAVAFDPAGNLFGVTGDGADSPETLFQISTVDGSTTFIRNLGIGGDGESLAYNPSNGSLYHGSGLSGPCGGNGAGVCFESIAIGSFATTPIDIDGSVLQTGEVQALTYWTDGLFLWGQNNFAPQELFLVDAAGSAIHVGQLDHQAKGLAWVVDPTGTVEVAVQGRAGYQLHPGYPNPFREAITIRFDLPAPSFVSLRIHDARGSLVRVLESSRKERGGHSARWDGLDRRGRRAAPGVYFLRIDAGAFRMARKMVMLE